MHRVIVVFILLLGIETYSQKNFFLNNAYNRNILKLNVLGLPSGMVSLKYERILLDKTKTLNVGVNYLAKRDVPFLNMFDSWVNDEKTLKILKGTTLSNFSFIPELRFYLGGLEATGFYVAPSVRFDYYKLNVPIEYHLEQFSDHVNLSGPLNVFAFGFSVGKQWKISQRWYIDWTILNLSYNMASGNFEKQVSLTAEQQRYLDYELSSFLIKNVDFTYDIDERGVKSTVKSNMLIPRMTLSVGCRF